MKGVAYIITLAVMALGCYGLLYVVLTYPLTTEIRPWGLAHIIEGNMTTTQTTLGVIWDYGMLVVPVIAFVLFLISWSQKRGYYDM